MSLTRGRKDPGVWALPDGVERYRYQVRRMTTTDLSPDQIQQIGLKKLAETEAEMIELAHQLGYRDLANLNGGIKKDRKLSHLWPAGFRLYTKYTRQMETQLPKLLGRLSKNKLILIPIDPQSPRMLCLRTTRRGARRIAARGDQRKRV